MEWEGNLTVRVKENEVHGWEGERSVSRAAGSGGGRDGKGVIVEGPEHIALIK